MIGLPTKSLSSQEVTVVILFSGVAWNRDFWKLASKSDVDIRVGSPFVSSCAMPLCSFGCTSYMGNAVAMTIHGIHLQYKQ